MDAHLWGVEAGVVWPVERDTDYDPQVQRRHRLVPKTEQGWEWRLSG